MILRFLVISLGLLFYSNFSLAQMPELPSGVWVVVHPPDSLAPALAGSMQPYVGNKVVFRKRCFRTFFSTEGSPPFTLKRQHCRNPEYSWSTTSREAFYRQHEREEFGGLYQPAGDTLQVLRVRCSNDASIGGDFYYLSDDYLLLSYLGLYCYLQPRREARRLKR